MECSIFSQTLECFRGYIAFFWECLQIECSHGASFNKKTKVTDDQKASVYHVATAGVRFRIFFTIIENISKIF